MRHDDIITGLLKGIWGTAGLIFAGELTLMALHFLGLAN